MGAVRKATVPILDSQQIHRGELKLLVLPRVKPEEALLWDDQDDPGRDASLEAVQVLENCEYRYEIHLTDLPPGGMAVTTSHDRDVFEPDDETGRRGRLRSRLFTGALHVHVYAGEAEVGALALEVRSAKFGYLQHYRWMLGEIADEFTEVVMERFAASEQRFTFADSGEAATLYQRFAFLKHLIAGETFETALHQILSRPHRAWVEEEELRPPGQGIPARSDVVRQITGAAGARVPWPDGPVAYLPARLLIRRTEETLDTPENRFVKFALTHWRDVVADVDRALRTEKESSPVARGRREVRVVLERLDELLSAELFTEVGPLVQFPAGSQVLQKRAGYRELFRAYVQFDAAAALTWQGGEDVYSAGQRNVAALYEYWVFLRLRAVVAELCETRLREETLFEVGQGLTVTLKRGRHLMLEGAATRYGRQMHLALYFNKGFELGEAGSWTLPMRPDCSLRISTPGGSPVPFEEVWLHFDAKYRIDNTVQLFGKPEQYLVDEEAEEARTGKAKHTDLLKMHAYRDAIRKSAGSYVIFPGQPDQEKPFRMYHEILPGLGAFALRPVENGKPDGFDTLKRFIGDVLDHMSSQVTQHERMRYWEKQAVDPVLRADTPVPAAPFVTQPPADTRVLLGYVKSPAHHRWIIANGLYNLRADGRRGAVSLGSEQLAAQLVVLYSDRFPLLEVWRVEGHPAVMTRTNMLELEYPEPRSEFYFCLQLAEEVHAQWRGCLTPERVQAIHDADPSVEHGAPIATSWLHLVR